MHRRACSCIRLSRLARVLCEKGSSIRETGLPRFVNAQQFSGKIAPYGRHEPLKVDPDITNRSQLPLLAQQHEKAKVAL